MAGLGVRDGLFIRDAKVDIARTLFTVADIAHVRHRKSIPCLWAYESKWCWAVADRQVCLHRDLNILPNDCRNTKMARLF